MNLIDFILNLVGLLLWLNWRSVYFSPSARTGGSLASTLRAASSPSPRWFYFVVLMGLLLVRALFYWQIGPALPWTPRLSLGCTTLIFRSDLLIRMVFYSFVSFGAVLGVLYLWLLLLSCINSDVWEENPQQRFIQLQLGILRHFPAGIKLLLPLLAMTFIWVALHPVMVSLQMAAKCSMLHLLMQGGIIGLLVYLQAKYLFVGVLLLHLLNSYVFLGDHSFLSFIDSTAAKLLRPLRQRWLPLVVKRIDLAPVVAIALILEIFALLEWASRTSWAVKHFEMLAS